MDTHQLCAILKRALDMRTDVQRSNVRPAARAGQLDVDIVKRDGVTIHREAGIAKLIESTEPIGTILTAWLGEEPAVKGTRAANWHAARATAFAYSPTEALKLHQNRRPTKPTTPPPNPQAPGSSLHWPDGKEPSSDTPTPNPIPAPGVNAQNAQPTYKDPITNEVRPKLRRSEMVKLGMTQEQRSEQYRRQYGPHPDDL